MRGEDKANYLALMDKRIIAAIKDGAWDEVAACVGELQAAIGGAVASRADRNWSRPAELQALALVQPEKKLAWAVGEGHQSEDFLGDVPTCLGLLGENKERSLELVQAVGQELAFYAFKVNPTGEDICKGLRDLLVHTVLYRAFLQEPRKFGYNTEKSPLLLDEPSVRWELIGPKDLINPRRQELRWGERDTQAMERLMRHLGVVSFSLGRMQAEGEALRGSLAKESFTGDRARQWFENRTSVVVA